MKNVCVYCGSSPGRQPTYADAANSLGRLLAEREIGLIYGGARVGIMGMVADAVLAHGGRAVGVIPESLMQKELAHQGLAELHVTTSMHERKMMMADLSDGFIAMPGGVGTLEEIFEAWTWAQLGFHRKPCGLLNVAGYYDHLSVFLDHTVTEQFVRERHRGQLMVETDPATLLDRFIGYKPTAMPKWIDRDQT
ncbi:uncharacterized protein (TIGR00730 family) [Natronocella acetinitrilica]|uniref:Cytokinin riboside 5'-monophosphate phosphoribohydrolase n=1 Tax=Natronocella acetinitrilica TaxID=414046 RepID=A0AAE3G7X3_9GAMM|nr:TIGR00730 family Rossman fold protein [Natronocella acetinitrilica]MCP1677102.1 uncharacterized protein (TIGR00730 family) [Natronocella acetinitrilica]